MQAIKPTHLEPGGPQAAAAAMLRALLKEQRSSGSRVHCSTAVPCCRANERAPAGRVGTSN